MITKEEFFKEFRQRKMSEEDFLENFYNLKEEASTYFNLFDSIATINIVTFKPNNGILPNPDIWKVQDYIPNHLTDLINPKLNPWIMPENRSDSLKLFLELTDDSLSK